MFPRSLCGWERHLEWQGHHPASLRLRAPAHGPGLCPLAAGSNMLDSSVNAPESCMMPPTLPSSKEVFLPVEQLEQQFHKQNVNSGMDPEVAPMSMAVAALSDLSHAGEYTMHRLCYLGPAPTTTQVLWYCFGLDVWMWPPSGMFSEAQNY